MSEHRGLLLDTNVFNNVADGTIDVESFKGRRLLVTHVQRDELSRTKDVARRAKLLATFELIAAEAVPTASAVLDESRWDEAEWGIEDDVFEQMKDELDLLNNTRPIT